MQRGKILALLFRFGHKSIGGVARVLESAVQKVPQLRKEPEIVPLLGIRKAGTCKHNCFSFELILNAFYHCN